MHYWQQLWLLDALTSHHHGPSRPCDLIGKRDGSDLDPPPPHEVGEPQPFRAVLSCISDDSHRTGDELPSQISITLF
jgi:hypothetical protein